MFAVGFLPIVGNVPGVIKDALELKKGHRTWSDAHEHAAKPVAQAKASPP